MKNALEKKLMMVKMCLRVHIKSTIYLFIYFKN